MRDNFVARNSRRSQQKILEDVTANKLSHVIGGGEVSDRRAMSGGLGWQQGHVGRFGRQQSAVGWLGRDTNVSLRVLQGTARGGSLILHCAKSVTKQREKLHDGSVLGETSPSAVTVTDQSWGNLTVSGDCGGSVLGKPRCQGWISPGETSL